MTIYKKAITAFFLMAFILSGCQILESFQPTATPEPTPTPVPPKELNICVGYEPDSLYLYAASSKVAQNILQAVYDGPFDHMISGETRPVILEKMPSLVDGSAGFIPVSVSAGDEVVDVYGYPTILQNGTEVFPSGCTSPACAITWDGVMELQMDELSVDFSLISGIKWSDGEALKPSDSTFSFNIADDPATPGKKLVIDQTAEYKALDERTVQWRGKPGLVTDAFADYFWTPLPEHILGNFSAAELLELDEAKRSPLGWGAFIMTEWADGEYIRLDRNPGYFRAGDGLPFYDTVFFRVMDPAQAGQINSDQCDFVADSLLDLGNVDGFLSSPAASGMSLQTRPSRDLEMLAIGIKPASYDDNYYPYGVDRPDIFGDARTRQAIAFCIDRATITEKMLKGYVEASNALLPPNDPQLTGAALADYSYNPTQGAALLDAVGWKDLDLNPQTPLIASQVFNVPIGTPFTITIHASDAPMQGEIAAEIAGNLANCGIQADIVQLPAAEAFRSAPDGPVFGRAFDLALVPLRLTPDFDCTHFTSNEIPSNANYWLGEVTGGANFYSYSSAAYDLACRSMRSAGLDASAEGAATRQAIEILSNELPFITLFHYPDLSAVSEEICGLENAGDYEQSFTQIESIKDGGACP